MKMENLTATLQKSYYGKAKVFIYDDFKVLRSYNTDVVAIDLKQNKIVRLWSGYSVTTMRHINDFLIQNNFDKLSKKEWLNLPCVNNETTYNIYCSTGFCTHKSNILLTEQEAELEIERIQKNSNRLYAWYE